MKLRDVDVGASLADIEADIENNDRMAHRFLENYAAAFRVLDETRKRNKRRDHHEPRLR